MASLSRGSDISSASLAARAFSTTMPCIASRRAGPANLSHALFDLTPRKAGLQTTVVDCVGKVGRAAVFSP